MNENITEFYQSNMNEIIPVLLYVLDTEKRILFNPAFRITQKKT